MFLPAILACSAVVSSAVPTTVLTALASGLFFFGFETRRFAFGFDTLRALAFDFAFTARFFAALR